jgi:membrane-bound lytic murein transglycosylase D
MAIRARLRAAGVGFSLVLALGAFSRSAAEPFSLIGLEGTSPERALDRISADQRDATKTWLTTSAPDFTPESTNFGARPEAEALPAAPVAEEMDAWAEAFAASRMPQRVVAGDAWAEAFAGSRLPEGLVAVETPAYRIVMTPQVQEFLDLFTGKRRELVALWLSRSGRYLGMIRETLRSRGLPEELAYTAMIESGFKPDAVSRMGARGMWQFMAATARRYGLRVDSWVDERYDPEKSTVAAAAYLRDLHRQFGSWALAQAAYNAGEVKIARAIRKTGSSDFWTLAESKYLRRETKDFVPQIHAATLIGKDPDRYGFEFGDPEPIAVEVVRVPSRTDLRRLAASSGVPYATLRSLNRVLVRGITPPGKTWELRVPAGSADTVLTALAPRRQAPVVAGAGKTVRAAASGEIHVVRPRDTVTSIARQYGVSVGDVLRWNRLEQQARIRPGDRLQVATRPSVERDGQGGFR